MRGCAPLSDMCASPSCAVAENVFSNDGSGTCEMRLHCQPFGEPSGRIRFLESSLLFLRPPRHLIIAARLVDSRSGLQCMRFWTWHWRGRRPALMASGNRRKFADKPVASPLRTSAYRSPPSATVQVWRMLGAAAGMPKPQQPTPQGLGAVSGRQPKPGEYPHREILVMSNSRQ